jgi:large subunit ribosomal protein L10
MLMFNQLGNPLWVDQLSRGDSLVALNLEGKKAIVVEVNATASNALSLVIADARGVSVTDMTTFREKAREQNIDIRVIRNTLAKRAFEGTEFECVNEVLTGPSLFGFSMEDPGAAARLFKDFAKANDKFEVKALSISGQLLDKEQIDVLAKLPTLEQALGQLASVTLAPVMKLVRTFNEVPTKITRVVAAVGDQKQKAA